MILIVLSLFSLKNDDFYENLASLTKLEREVLADPQAFLKYESLLRQGKRVEAVAALRFYVHLRKVHDSNSKSLKGNL